MPHRNYDRPGMHDVGIYKTQTRAPDMEHGGNGVTTNEDLTVGCIFRVPLNLLEAKGK